MTKITRWFSRDNLESDSFLQFIVFFAIGVAFFFPNFSALISRFQTFATMEEANSAIMVRDSGVWSAIVFFYEQYTSPGWQRHHFFGLFLDAAVLGIHDSPRTLRVLRLMECGILSGLLGILFLNVKPFAKSFWLRFLIALGAVALVLRSMPLAISFAAVFELEGILFSLWALCLVYSKGNRRYLILFPLLVLTVVKETFLPYALLIGLFALARDTSLYGLKSNYKYKISLLGGLAILLFVTFYYWSLSKTGSYAGRYGSILGGLPEFAKWRAGIELSGNVLLILVGLGILLLLGLLTRVRPIRESFFTEKTSYFALFLLALVMSEGYRLLVFPWIGQTATAYYYLPCWVFSEVALMGLVGVILSNLPALWGRTTKNFILAGLVLVTLNSCKIANHELHVMLRDRAEMLKLVELMENYNTATGKEIPVFQLFEEALERLSQSNQIVRGGKPLKYRFVNEFSTLSKCWTERSCSLIITERETQESIQFFETIKNEVYTVKLGAYTVYNRIAK